MKNILKIVFLGIFGFGLLVFFTVDKPMQIQANSATSMSISSLPNEIELVGKDQLVSKNDLFKANTKTLIIVGNHDSLAVVKELPTLFDIQLPYVMVANISSAPWFVKKMFIPSKLEELNKGSNIPMIYDFEGDVVRALKVSNNDKTRFIAYVVNTNGSIQKIYEGDVKEGALDGTMSTAEIKASLEPLVKKLK